MYSIGQIELVSGNFSMLGFVMGYEPAELERRVGFHDGRLKHGYAIATLANGLRLEPRDFELQGSTRWSGGFTRGKAAHDGRELEILLKQRGQNILELKKKVCEFFAKGGAKTPAKILPFLKHQPGMEYPGATALGQDALGKYIPSGVPQFNLVVPRLFSVVRVWSPQ